MFTNQELNNILVFMKRCQLTGEESTTHAILLGKIQSEIQKLVKEPEVPKVEVTGTE